MFGSELLESCEEIFAFVVIDSSVTEWNLSSKPPLSKGVRIFLKL